VTSFDLANVEQGRRDEEGKGLMMVRITGVNGVSEGRGLDAV
jgi:hypothetical protein